MNLLQILAIGYDEGAWGGSIKEYVFEWPLRIDENHPDERIARLVILRCDKWGDNFPEYYGMESLGYLERTTFGGSSVDIYMITEKALRLADAPAVPPNVFISYKRSESSAFALLLEARIKYETNARPFLDKDIEPGEAWHVPNWKKRSKRVRRLSACWQNRHWIQIWFNLKSAGQKPVKTPSI